MDECMKQQQTQTVRNAPGLGAAPTQPIPCPPRPWAECGIVEKVDRLREELLSQRWFSRHANSEMARVAREINGLSEHSHDALGKPVVPFRMKFMAAGGQAVESSFDPLA